MTREKKSLNEWDKISHLHHGYRETPPGVAERTLSPQRLRAVDVAEGDRH